MPLDLRMAPDAIERIAARADASRLAIGTGRDAPDPRDARLEHFPTSTVEALAAEPGQGSTGGAALADLGRERLDGRRREALEPGVTGIRRVAPGADRQARRIGPHGDPLDRVGRHPQVERDDDDTRPDRAVVDGRQLGR